ncbi:AAA family ATPase [Acinetobacter cumulans]|uniref:AAA family ATPase n=1 Tax=Acinetobacter cumulans TaxID=2136182 RepID=A0A3A8G7H6_9GAMM|nr:AAA family ATPase [Acinetobacter cumulans]RKG53916.1 AAA family ATPase [Acinetobacter cumulans]
MKFQKIEITGWRQFSNIEIEFHPKVTIITGANGAGKSTILKLLSKHFGWHQIFLSTPYLSKDKGSFLYKSFFTPVASLKSEQSYSQNVLGNIFYTDTNSSQICFFEQPNQAQFDLQIHNQRHVDGLHINSHRPVPNYQRLQNIPTNPMDASQAFQNYFQETLSLFNNGHSGYSPIYRMKEAIVSMAAFGPGNQFVQPNEKIEKQFNDFKEILKNILPKDLGFKDLSIRIPDIVLETETGEFLLDAASGGIMSIIDLAWQIFLYSHNKEEFVVTLDEPENHLHPSMQRSLLNNFVNAFPKAQFIVVTHSPFIVSSIRDSNVYALKYEISKGEQQQSKKVTSYKLDLDQKAATANEILRDILGVPVTLPQWADDDLQEICKKFTVSELTPEGIANLREQLSNSGLSEFYPEALNHIIGRRI